MKLIHMTDIHLTTPGERIAERDPNANFERALDHVLEIHADAELMVITGDLSDWGDKPDYVRLKERLARFPIPSKLCIGNHDDRSTMLSVFPELADESGFVQHIYDASAGRLLFLDTWGPDTHAGHFCEARRAWLDAELSKHPGPFYIFQHHNPMPTHIKPTDTIRLLDDVAYRALIAPHRDKVRHIFHGHCHLPMAGSVSGVPVTSIRGTNHASWPNFPETQFLSGAHLPQAYGVAFLKADYTTVIMVEFGYDGEIRTNVSPEYATWSKQTTRR